MPDQYFGLSRLDCPLCPRALPGLPSQSLIRSISHLAKVRRLWTQPATCQVTDTGGISPPSPVPSSESDTHLIKALVPPFIQCTSQPERC